MIHVSICKFHYLYSSQLGNTLLTKMTSQYSVSHWHLSFRMWSWPNESWGFLKKIPLIYNDYIKIFLEFSQNKQGTVFIFPAANLTALPEQALFFGWWFAMVSLFILFFISLCSCYFVCLLVNWFGLAFLLLLLLLSPAFFKMLYRCLCL